MGRDSLEEFREAGLRVLLGHQPHPALAVAQGDIPRKSPRRNVLADIHASCRAVAIGRESQFRLQGPQELPGTRQSQRPAQRAVNAGGDNGHLGPQARRPRLRRLGIDGYGVLFHGQRVHPAAQLYIHARGDRPLGQRPIEFTFVDHLGERGIGTMFEGSSPRGNCLNAPHVRQNRMLGEVEARESLVAHDPGADGALANPALGLAEDDVQPRLRQ